MSIRPRIPAATLVRSGRPAAAAPENRFELDGAQWEQLVERLATDALAVSGLWCDGAQVHALLLEGGDAPLIASVPVEAKRFLALSPSRPHLAVAERIVRDLWGVEAMGALDLRPWLDHGVWSNTAPLSARPGPAAWPPEPPDFEWSAADEQAGAMQLPLGPAQPLLFGPAQLRITLGGERVRRIEPLLGYAHRGVAARLRGQSPAAAARLVGRLDATACVSHQIAFAQATEAALGGETDASTRALRAGMAALERIAARLRGGGATLFRNALADACSVAFGSRLMRDVVMPGRAGVSPAPDGMDALLDALARIEAFAAREPAGDDALRRDLVLAKRMLQASPPAGRSTSAPSSGVVEGLGSAEAPHGRIWHWVRFENGLLTAWHAVDPTPERLFAVQQAARGMVIEDALALLARLALPVAGTDQ